MVTAPEAAALLAYASEFDNRGSSQEGVRAWATILAEYDFQACREQIVAHYSREHRWIMPADVKKGIDNDNAANELIIMDKLDALEPPEWLNAMEDGPEFTAAFLGWRKEQGRRIRSGEPLDVGTYEVTVSEETVNKALESMRSSLVP